METARTLTVNLANLLRREHDALAEFLVALADFDRRRCANSGHHRARRRRGMGDRSRFNR